MARCGQRKDVCSLCIGANDVGPCCCVVTHRGDVLQRVVGTAHGDAGNVIGMVLDYPTAHGRGVGRHVDEPDVGMRLPMEDQEFLADVQGTHVHEADPWGAAAIGVHDSGVQPCEEGE